MSKSTHAWPLVNGSSSHKALSPSFRWSSNHPSIYLPISGCFCRAFSAAISIACSCKTKCRDLATGSGIGPGVRWTQPQACPDEARRSPVSRVECCADARTSMTRPCAPCGLRLQRVGLGALRPRQLPAAGTRGKTGPVPCRSRAGLSNGGRVPCGSRQAPSRRAGPAPARVVRRSDSASTATSRAASASKRSGRSVPSSNSRSPQQTPQSTQRRILRTPAPSSVGRESKTAVRPPQPHFMGALSASGQAVCPVPPSFGSAQHHVRSAVRAM